MQAGGHRFDPVHLHQYIKFRREITELKIICLYSEVSTLLSDFCSLTTEGKRKGQVRKGIWRMPWHQEAKKDAAGCEKPRGVASERRSVGVRMGQPTPRRVGVSYDEYIVI